ncbi:MAG: hypothetical protein E7001_08155 [Coriobacteriaceae bacterium]|nr:hypothetical protein [Coriobacteriaceae bacterium]
MPTGGVSKANLGDYLGNESIIAVGDTWMVEPALFVDGSFDEVERLAGEAMAAARAVRGQGA